MSHSDERRQTVRTGPKHGPSRRTYLGLLGAVGLGASLSGCLAEVTGRSNGSNTPTAVGDGPTVADPVIRFSAVVDAVSDLGMDSTGQRPIDDAFDDAVGDDTLLTFPPGVYRVTRTHVCHGLENFGIQGTGANRNDTRYVIPDRSAMQLFVVDGGRNILVDNVTFDQQSKAHNTSIGNSFVVDDGLLIRDVEYAGYNPNGNADYEHSLAVRITRASGVGVIERFVQVGPSDLRRGDGYGGVGNPIAIWCGGESPGTLYIRDAHIENTGELGVYAAHSNGPVRVEGGLFRNCAHTALRVAGPDSYIRGATVEIDANNADPDNVGEFAQLRGIWWEAGDTRKTGGLIEDCTLVMRSIGQLSQGLLRVESNAGGLTIRNVRLECDVDGIDAFFARTPGEWTDYPTPAKPWNVVLEDVTVAGTAAGGAAVRIAGRPASVLRNVTIEQTGADRDGIVLEKSAGSVLEGVSVATTRYPLHVVSGATLPMTCPATIRAPVQLDASQSLDATVGPLESLPLESGVYCVGGGSLLGVDLVVRTVGETPSAGRVRTGSSSA